MLLDLLAPFAEEEILEDDDSPAPSAGASAHLAAPAAKAPLGQTAASADEDDDKLLSGVFNGLSRGKKTVRDGAGCSGFFPPSL